MQQTLQFEKFVLNGLLMLFIASLIMFDLEGNVIYSNIMNVILWAGVGFSIFVHGNYTFPKNRLAVTYAIFTAFSLASVFWAYDFDLAYDYGTRLVIVLINIIVLYYMFVNYEVQNAILWGVLIGSLYNYMILFKFINPSYDTYEFGRFLGSSGNPNKLSKIMIISIFASLVLLNRSGRNLFIRFLLIANIVLAFYMTFMTISKKGVIIAPLLVLMSFSFRDIRFGRIIMWTGVSAVVVWIMLAIVPQGVVEDVYQQNIYRFMGFFDTISGVGGDNSTDERAHLVELGLKQFYKDPFFGIGLNNFRLLFVKYAHNNFIELLVGVGLIGTILFYLIYSVVWRRVYKMKPGQLKRYCVVIIMVLLFMDLTSVSYFDKLLLAVLLFVYYTASGEKKILPQKDTAPEPALSDVT